MDKVEILSRISFLFFTALTLFLFYCFAQDIIDWANSTMVALFVVVSFISMLFSGFWILKKQEEKHFPLTGSPR